MTMNSLNNVLASSDAESLKFENVGDSHFGTITDVEVRQVRNFDTEQPEFWDDGNPKQQIVVTIDKGGSEGRIFIKLWGEWKRNLVRAIQSTGLDADNALAPGNSFYAFMSELRPNEKNPRLHPSKILNFEITPRANVGGALGMGQDAPAPAPQAPQAPQAQPQAPQATPAAPVTPATPTPEPAASPLQQVTQLIDQGMTDDQIAQQLGMDTAVVGALRANANADPNRAPF